MKILEILAVCALIALTGCTTTTTKIQYKGAVTAALLYCNSYAISPKSVVKVYDQEFNIVSYDYIKNDFSRAFWRYKATNGWLTSYTKNSRDCENYALTLIHFCHNMAQIDTKKGFPVAFITYITDDGTYHAICAFRTDKGIKFYEPQGEEFVYLSDTEKKNIDLFIWFG